MELRGKIKEIQETQTFGDNGFTKRGLVITTDEQYPQYILIEFIKDKCKLLDAYNIGDYICVSINIRGREWTNKEGKVLYFNTIQGWRIEGLGDELEGTNPLKENKDSGDLPF